MVGTMQRSGGYCEPNVGPGSRSERVTVDYLYSLYDALVSINVPGDKARAVIDAMERDMGTTLATKVDLQILRQDGENRFAMLAGDIAALRADLTREIGLSRSDAARESGLLRREMDSFRGEVAKEFESVRKEMDGFRAEVTREFALVRREMEVLRGDLGRDMEALRLTMTVRLGSMLIVAVGVMLTVLRAWL